MMKELSEEDFQKLLQQQLHGDEEQASACSEGDEALYRVLFNALADEPVVSLNAGLAKAVVEQIQINERKAESLRYNMIIAAVIITGVLFAYFAIDYISPIALKSALNFIAVNKWIVLFIIFCFGLIEIADKNLVKKKLAGALGH